MIKPIRKKVMCDWLRAHNWEARYIPTGGREVLWNGAYFCTRCGAGLDTSWTRIA